MFLFFRKRKKIYPIVFEQSDFAYLYRNCPVCICELKSKPCTTLVCGHSFHTDCILDSFKSCGMKCPLCKEKYIWAEKKNL